MKNKITVVIGIIVLSLIIINMSASHSKLSKTVDSKNSIEMKTIYFAEPGIVTKSITNLGKIDKVNLAYDETSDNNLRYIGKDPNNYVLFNNELWRIIGVMNNIDDGNGNNETKIKLIKDKDLYTNVAFDSNHGYNYSTSSLKEKLNKEYYNGIYSNSKKMIDGSLWYTYLKNSTNNMANNFYQREREVNNGDKVWIGNIGLIYPSDFGFASNLVSCRKKYELNSISKDCSISNYLYNNTWWEWTITSSSTGQCRIDTRYFIGCDSASYDTPYSTKPSLYLKPSTKITGGYGTKSKPYTIGL